MLNRPYVKLIKSTANSAWEV